MNCVFYQQFRTGKPQTANQKATRRAYGFSTAKKRKNYTKPTQAILRSDNEDQRRAKWATSSLGQTLHDHELNKFVDTRYATNKRPEEVFNADIVVYKKLTQAVKDGRNIVYESTGESLLPSSIGLCAIPSCLACCSHFGRLHT